MAELLGKGLVHAHAAVQILARGLGDLRAGQPVGRLRIVAVSTLAILVAEVREDVDIAPMAINRLEDG